jgi:hypothetical protein
VIRTWRSELVRVPSDSVWKRGLTWWSDGQLTEDVPKSLSRESDLHFHGPLYYTSFFRPY